MTAIRVLLRYKDSRVLIQAKDPQEVEKLLDSVPSLFKKIDGVLEKLALSEGEIDYKGVIGIDEAGAPVLKAMRPGQTDKESIMLLLYATGDSGLKAKDIYNQLDRSGIVAKGYAARITELRQEGFITKRQTGEYTLTERGKIRAKELLRRVKQEIQEAISQ